MDWTPIIAMVTLAAVFITALSITSKQTGARIGDLKTDLTNTENRLTKRFDRLEEKLDNISRDISKLGERTARTEGDAEKRELENLLELVKK